MIRILSLLEIAMELTRRSRSVLRPAMIEGLEGRMLLSAQDYWAATWNLSGIGFDVVKQAPTTSRPIGGAVNPFKGPLKQVKITEIPSGYHIESLTPGVSFSKDLVNQGDSLTLDYVGDSTNNVDQYLRLQKLSDNSVVFFVSSITYDSPSRKCVVEGEASGGLATRNGTPATFKTFSFTGTRWITTTGIEGLSSSTGASSHSTTGMSGNATISYLGLDPTGQKAYKLITPTPEKRTELFFDNGSNQLTQEYVLQQADGDKSYVRSKTIIMQASDGRLIYIGAQGIFSSKAYTDSFGHAVKKGDLREVSFDAGYSKPSNFAPVLSTTKVFKLNSIVEDQKKETNSGTSIAQLIASAGTGAITDGNTSANRGIAITAIKSGVGTWQYSKDGGVNWLAISSVSTTSALLLASDSGGLNRIRLVPAANYNGTITGAIAFKAWDQSAKVNGTKVNVSPGGGASAFSTTSTTARITVTPVNDKPSLGGLPAATTPRYVEGAAPVKVLPSVTVADIDSANMKSATVAITGSYVPGEDLLLFSNTSLIKAAAFDVATGTLTLTGTASKAAYQAALRTIQYRNKNANNPQTAVRTLSVTISDGSLPSATKTQSVKVAAVNDAPVLTYRNSTVKRITLTGATKNTAFSIDFATLQSAIDGIATYRDVDSSVLGFSATKVAGTLSKNGTAATTVTLMSGGTIAWKPATGVTGTVKAFQVRIWDGNLASVNLVDVYIKVA